MGAERSVEWPVWADRILRHLKDCGYEYDPGEEIDLPGDFVDHVREWISGIERDAKKKVVTAEAALATALAKLEAAEASVSELAKQAAESDSMLETFGDVMERSAELNKQLASGEKVRAALEPFARIAHLSSIMTDDRTVPVSMNDCRRALEALAALTSTAKG